MKAAVLIPSRDRPGLLVDAIRSVLDTSAADVLVYVDEDQWRGYQFAFRNLEPIRVKGMYGDRIGPVASANALVKSFHGYDAYGLITDDSGITTPGWDQWTLEAIARFPGRIAVVSPHHPHGYHVDMPFVSKEWIERVGWYACPLMKHYAWPIITGLIGEMTGIVHAPESAFHIEHAYDPNANQDVRAKDYEAFFSFVSRDLPIVVATLRKEMYESKTVTKTQPMEGLGYKAVAS
jgi:hypothetical protein